MMRSSLLCILVVLLCAGAVSSGELSYEDPAPSKNTALLKSALWPGLGQIEQGRIGRGAVWAGGALALVAGTFFSNSQYNSAAMDFESAKDNYERALADWNLDDAEYYLAEMKDLHALSEDRKSVRTGMEVALILWWGGSLVDTWLFDKGDGVEDSQMSALPGRLEPVMRRGAAGLAWSVDF